MQCYFAVPKNIRLNFPYYFMLKTPNKQELQQISFNHPSNIEFMKIYKNCTTKPYSALVICPTLVSDSTWHFRKSLLERK